MNKTMELFKSVRSIRYMWIVFLLIVISCDNNSKELLLEDISKLAESQTEFEIEMAQSTFPYVDSVAYYVDKNQILITSKEYNNFRNICSKEDKTRIDISSKNMRDSLTIFNNTIKTFHQYSTDSIIPIIEEISDLLSNVENEVLTDKNARNKLLLIQTNLEDKNKNYKKLLPNLKSIAKNQELIIKKHIAVINILMDKYNSK